MNRIDVQNKIANIVVNEWNGRVITYTNKCSESEYNEIAEFLNGMPDSIYEHFDYAKFAKHLLDNEKLYIFYCGQSENFGCSLGPVFGVMKYFFDTYLMTTIENWPFDSDYLKSMLNLCNYSTDVLYDF